MNFTPVGPHLPDTSAVILRSRAGMMASAQAWLPFVVQGELLVGIYRSVEPIREGARLDAAIGEVPILHPTWRTAHIHAQNAAQLQRSGRLIPTNDLWIAALALERSLPLLTDDTHFARVQGLKLLFVR